ncbi:DNA cytosine methyltransferase [Marinifilum breve]|uniref:DNA (cytosine-5-)-methyltransferase n=1 Tax=Marinifilum breve TaxID=2184082 RepID=A0A2V3ZZZ6_9BACT|nr:DNA (cytosine-5-)-methyltransferase [Marinifilum breve]PXY01853.1 DNA cytosine methyltransferase [Marinifilum breve]
MTRKIPIIDLFAGPGGLGEGFSSLKDDKGNRVFDIKLSIEKDENAHQTLRLRSFFRKLDENRVPDLYYDFIKENNSKRKNELFKELTGKYSEQWEQAEDEAWHCELPFPEETKTKNGIEYTIGYTQEQINKRHVEIDTRIKKSLDREKNFLLIGGPPCQAYSLVGRSRNQGISNSDHRVHLYKEYLRIIAKHHPAVFVMENVKGLLSANVNGERMFDLIKSDLQDPNSVFPDLKSSKYKVYSFVKQPESFDLMGFPAYEDNTDFLIQSERYGIPQRRHRVILLGVREDIKYDGKQVLDPEEQVSLDKVIGNLPKLRSGIGRQIIGKNEKGNHKYAKIENNLKNWSNAVYESAKKLKSEFPNINSKAFQNLSNNQGANFVKTKLNEKNNPLFKNWYQDKRLNGVLNHETRTHLKEDLCRYLFSSIYLEEKGDFPKLRDYPEWLLPEHKNAKGGKFADRFRTQRPDIPATTITSHISKDGHYFIHYDPKQCRSLTVREAARIQTFPDNYYFCGTRTQQYHQVGNAVPPYIANQIAKIVCEIFKSCV